MDAPSQRTQWAGRLDADAAGRIGQVGERDLLDLDDLDPLAVGARAGRPEARFLARLLDGRAPAAGTGMEDPVDLAADGGDRRADRVGDREVLGPQNLA